MSQANLGASSNKLKFKGKSNLMKELQRTASFWAYNTVLTSGNSKAQTVLEDLVAKKYFGDTSDPDSMGYVEQLLRGLGAFAAMYEDPMIEGTVTAARGALPQLTMKRDFHCQSEIIVCSSNPNDEGINMAVLCSKALTNRRQLSPNNIFKNAKLVEQNGRKALALVQRSEYKDGKMPSGKNFQDYLLFLREAMYKDSLSVVGIVANDGASVDGDRSSSEQHTGVAVASEAVVPPEMKDDWIFPGYIPFALWGPIIPDGTHQEYKAEAFFMQDDPKKTTGGGRAKLRAAERSEGSRGSAPSSVIDLSRDSHHHQVPPPVSTNKDVLFAAFIVQQETLSGMKQLNHQQNMMMQLLKSKIKSCRKELKLWKSMVSPSVISSTNENALYIMTELKLAKKNLSDATLALDNFIAESTITLPTPEEVEKGKQQKNDFMQLVGKALSNTVTPAARAADGGGRRRLDHGENSSTSKRQRGIGTTPCSLIEIPDNWNTLPGRDSSTGDTVSKRNDS